VTDEPVHEALRVDDVEPGPSVVTIGSFDGVHRGHQTLVRRAVDAASERGVRSVAVTFEPHPSAVVRPGSEPPYLQTLSDRITSLYVAGIDRVLVLDFTPALAALEPHEFLERVLVGRLAPLKVVVGTNFRFGHQAAGDVVALAEGGEQHGYEVEAVTLLELDGEPISSSAIRDRLADGDVAWPTRALGRPYEVVGEVVAGEGRGRTIGVPTANVAPAGGLLVPANGVYAGHARLGERSWPCVTNVGTRPTFDGRDVTVESHLLDVEEELYGQRLAVSFEHRLRGERKFDGPDELVAQIRRDLDAARELLSA
jgi:riboflavin kinase / FMN adenylyltransferase